MVFESPGRTILIGAIVLACGCGRSFSVTPHQATGIKIGEVTHDAAIVWTRLTRVAQRVGAEAPMPEVRYLDPKTENPDSYPTGHGPQGDAIRIYNYVRLVRDAQ